MEVKFNPSDIHDIDYYGQGPTQYAYKGQPVVGKHMFNGVAPKGYNPTFKGELINELDNNDYASKNFLIIDNTWKMIKQVIMQQYKFSNLPDELDCFNFFDCLIEYGRVALWKHGNSYVYSDFTIINENYDKSPKQIEVKKGSVFKKLTKDKFSIIRFDVSESNIYYKVIQYIHSMILNLRKLHNNTMKSSVKGLILGNLLDDINGQQTPLADSLENIINSDKTFFSINLGDLENDDLLKALAKAKGKDSNFLFDTLKIDDMSESYMKTFNFFKELIKEIIGLDIDMDEKKERKITKEISAQQGMGKALLWHRYEVMKNDIELANKKFNIDIKFDWSEMVKEQREQENNRNVEVQNDKIGE